MEKSKQQTAEQENSKITEGRLNYPPGTELMILAKLNYPQCLELNKNGGKYKTKIQEKWFAKTWRGIVLRTGFGLYLKCKMFRVGGSIAHL